MNRRKFSLSIAGVSLASAALSAVDSKGETVRSEPSIANASTFTFVGKQEKPFLKQAEAVLGEKSGSGYLDHIWFGGSFPHFSRLRVRIFVDGEATPSIDMELGLGVGVGFEDPSAPWGTKFNGITGAPSGIFMNYRVPYLKSIRVTAALPPGVARDTVLWWIVRGVENMPLQVSGIDMPANARLRLHKKEGLTVQPLEEFALCDLSGAGMLFMVTMAAKSSNFEFMEARCGPTSAAAENRSFSLQDSKIISSGHITSIAGFITFRRLA